MIILGQNPLTFMIPIYSTTVLYDNTTLQGTYSNCDIKYNKLSQ